MHIVFRTNEGERELDVQLRNPDATLDDLVRAVLGRPAPGSVGVGDRVVPGSCPIVDSGLHEGAVLSTHAVADSGGEPGSRLELVIVAGRDAGRRFVLPIGRSLLGRTADNTIVLDDATVSRQHCTIELDESGAGWLTDAGSSNGTFADGVRVEGADAVALAVGSVIEVGAFALAIRSVTDADRPLSLVFSGKGMSAISGTPQATGVADCPRITWLDGDLLWCYSPTVTYKGSGAKLYAKGVLIDQGGTWHPVWSSPTITTT